MKLPVFGRGRLPLSTKIVKGGGVLKSVGAYGCGGLWRSICVVKGGRVFLNIWQSWQVMVLISFFGMIGGLGIILLNSFILSYTSVLLTSKLVYLILCHPQVGNDKVWNLGFYRDFHDWELEAVFSFLDVIQSQVLRGAGCDSLCWCLNGSGKFDTQSFYNEMDASNSTFPWKGVWKVKVPKIVAIFCGQQHIVNSYFG